MFMTLLEDRPSDNGQRWWRFELYECFLVGIVVVIAVVAGRRVVVVV